MRHYRLATFGFSFIRNALRQVEPRCSRLTDRSRIVPLIRLSSVGLAFLQENRDEEYLDTTDLLGEQPSANILKRPCSGPGFLGKKA
jgi:hypothetical protein